METRRKSAFAQHPLFPHTIPNCTFASSLSISGVNVTVPHKEAALIHVDEVPLEIDRAIGAVNVITAAKNGRLQGFNTDGPGFIEDLREKLGFSPAGKRVLLVGAGGAARAMAFYLVREKCETLLIYNRTPARARGLADYLGRFFPQSEIKAVLSVDKLPGGPAGLVVNASSCGMKPEDPHPVNPDILTKGTLVYDAVYAPFETELVKEAKRRGLKTADGAGMLIRQAVLSQALWFPQIDREAVRTIMQEAYASCKT